MTRSIKFFVFIIIIFFLFVSSASAESKKIIFDLATLTNNQTAGLWQIFNNTDKGLYPQGDNLLLRSDGDAYLVYDGQFSYHDYHRLRLVIASNQPLRLTVIPNVSTTGYNTYELRRELPASTELTEVTVSLRLPFFKKPVDDLGINFYSAKPAEILIKEISLEKLNSAELAAVAFKDYFRVFEYSPFTVNLFAAPRIFGRSALIYVLPIIIWLIWLSLKSKRWREVALILLLSCWLVIDLRMVYEFFNYQLADYRDYVKPPIAEKRLRTYQDF